MGSDGELELFPELRSPAPDPRAPLAERMRPRSLDEVEGQEALLGEGAVLRALLDAGELPSLVLWGPPGCGKTTLARLLAEEAGAELEALSAVTAGVKEIRAVVERARRTRRPTLLFLDEIHRLNRAQQDTLLPHVEAGTLTLIGATTENPSFEVIAPLLSRCRVLTLQRLDREALVRLLGRAARDPERGLGARVLPPSDAVLDAIAAAADGDARRALLLLEAAAAVARGARGADVPIALEDVKEAAGRPVLVHDRDREEHYNTISALIKSLRAGDADAALYWTARMLEAGEDPTYVARRLVIFAAEDVGNADPSALGLATSAFLAAERIGMPEARIPLAQAVTYLACAPKSRAAYEGIARAGEAVKEHGSLPVPMHLRNAVTPLMRELGYGRREDRPEEEQEATGTNLPPETETNLPPELGETAFYEPGDAGAEAEIAARLGRRRRR